MLTYTYRAHKAHFKVQSSQGSHYWTHKSYFISFIRHEALVTIWLTAHIYILILARKPWLGVQPTYSVWHEALIFNFGSKALFGRTAHFRSLI